MQQSLIIHGHFYQPPRENPWTERVQRERSAAPFHNWNERVFYECYRANARSRVTNGNNRIERIVNNYELLSFNFGPTLLSWMERHHPRSYQRIIDADGVSILRRAGHGNAIAQGYNHTILPLANARDRATQICWGIADFRFRFKREPEALWLPETAANHATLDSLIDAGLRYVILSPYQAGRIRPIAGGDWRAATDGWIDTSEPYSYYHRDRSARQIAVFFYHGPAAQSIAFGGALGSSQSFVDKLRGSGDLKLINVATDGESYGHHTKFADRTLTYALEVEGPARGLHVTNYGEYLDRSPPKFEVELIDGDGEGSAWSCAHGVGRWIRDCGCHTGGHDGWNQAWRGPLRQALDRVRDEGTKLFDDAGRACFRDPWVARDAYAEVILDRSRTDVFLEQHLVGGASDATKVEALKLLELQRQTQLMYTSCGWFFNDISGIETEQILKYAGRAMDFMVELGAPKPEADFLDLLTAAKSNNKEKGSGADVYRAAVDEARMSQNRVVAHVALSQLIADDTEESGEAGGFLYQWRDRRSQALGRIKLSTGRIALTALTTREQTDCVFTAMHLGGADFYCAARKFEGEAQYLRAKERLWSKIRTASLPLLLRFANELFGPEDFGLEHIVPDARERLSASIFSSLVSRFVQEYAHLYEENRRTLDMLQAAGFELPDELKTAAEFTLGHRLEDEILRQQRSDAPDAYRKAVEIAAEVAARGLRVRNPVARQLFSETVIDAVETLVADPKKEHVETALGLLDLIQQLGLGPNLDAAQEILYEARERLRDVPGLARLAETLNVQPALFQSSSG